MAKVGATTLSIMTFRIMTFSIMTLTKMGLFVTLSISTICNDECHNAECSFSIIEISTDGYRNRETESDILVEMCRDGESKKWGIV